MVAKRYIEVALSKNQMIERRVKKKTSEDDTCRDCWRERFRKEMMDLLEVDGIDASRFFNEELTSREKLYDEMRLEARDVYDEIIEVRALAGDVFMNRYSKEEKKKER